MFVSLYKHTYIFQQVGEECSKGGVKVMLLEVGQASHVVLTKSELRQYQCQTLFEQTHLFLDNLDVMYRTNSVVTIPFS